MRSSRRDDDDAPAAAASSASPSPVFSLTKWEEWRTNLAVSTVPPGIEDLKQLAAGGGVVLLSSANPNYVIRWNTLDATAQLVELRFKTTHKLKNSFVDPTGSHILVTAVGSGGPVVMYAHKDKAEAKELTKLKNVEVTSVAWDPDNLLPDTTGTILIGSSTGDVYEVVVEDRKEKRFNAVYRMAEQKAITGLRYDRCPPGSPGALFVLAATACPTRCYQFLGGPDFVELFGSLKNLYYNEIRGVDVDVVQLAVYSAFDKRSSVPTEARLPRPREFAMLTGFGVYHGRFNFRSSGSGEKVITGEHMIPYPSSGPGGPSEIPVAISLTEFHLLLLYPSKILALSTLNNEIVFEQGFKERFGEMRGMVTDGYAPGSVYPLIWLFSNRGVFQLNLQEEDRDVWKIYLQIAKRKGGKWFETALSFCKTEEQREMVSHAQADFLFSKGDMENAARSYAATRVPFEEVALKFVNAGEKRALKDYVTIRLGSFKPEDKIQKTVLGTWLTEMLLEEIVRLHSIPSTISVRMDTDAAEAAIQEFHQFLTDHAEDLDPPTTINLISSYDRMDDVLFYCSLIKDYERIVAHHVQHKDLGPALALLTSKELPEELVTDMFYKYTPALIQLDVSQTVKAWRRCKFLDPVKLIPSLVRYSTRSSMITASSGVKSINPEEQEVIVSYLSFVIRRGKHKSSAVYNYLLSLYAERDDDDGLLSLIEDQCALPQPLLDLNFALRLCSNRGKDRACVQLYKALRMYYEALDSALKVDLEAAQAVANTPDLEENLRKSLWMKLLRSALDSTRDIRIALGLLKNCDVLKIDDVLSLFPDFTVIDDFKAEISASLEGSSKKLQELREDMKDFTDSAERIRQDIKSLRFRCGVVKTAQKCEVCAEQLLQTDFYLFPCLHGFHSACLVNEMIVHLGPAQAARVKLLQKELRQLSGVTAPAGAPRDESSAAARLQTELDDTVATECPLCGEVMIESVGQPFLDDAERTSSEWDI